jgi:hypothetical protein
MIAYSNSIDASLIFRVATTDAVDGDWDRGTDVSRPLSWDSLIAIALRENVHAPPSGDSASDN